MDPLLNILLDLDRLDKDRTALERAEGDLPAQAQQLERELQSRSKVLSSLQRQLETFEQQLYATSHQVISHTAEINRLQENFSGTLSSREYEQLHATILAQQELLATSVASQTSFRAQCDSLRSELQIKQTDWDSFQPAAQAQLLQIKTALSDYQLKCQELDQQIVQKMAQLPSEYAKEWHMLSVARRQKKGVAQTHRLVYEFHLGETYCKSCFTELTRQVIRLLKEPGTIMNCPTCGAFLVSQNSSETRLA